MKFNGLKQNSQKNIRNSSNSKRFSTAKHAERRQKELQDMAERQEQFQQEAQQGMQKAQQEKMAPVYQKLDNAIKAVGEAEGVIYVFDLRVRKYLISVLKVSILPLK